MDMKALFTLSYGIYVVTSRREDRINGQIANTVFQITSDPPKLAVSINKTELTHEYIAASRICAVNVLSEDAEMKFIGNFGFRSGREFDKFANLEYSLADSGCPIPDDNVLASIDLKITDSIDMGTHTLFVGEVTDCRVTGTGTPMTYAYYSEVLRGKVPPTAPHAQLSTENVKTETKYRKEETVMKNYVCNICGYVYEPVAGDPDDGIEAGTAFEDLPDDWVCPVCGVGKDQFSEE